jgi:hypothetical protein
VTMSLRDLRTAMLTVSDNAATDAVLEAVGKDAVLAAGWGRLDAARLCSSRPSQRPWIRSRKSWVSRTMPRSCGSRQESQDPPSRSRRRPAGADRGEPGVGPNPCEPDHRLRHDAFAVSCLNRYGRAANRLCESSSGH